MSNKNKSSVNKNASQSAKEDMSICLIGPPGCGKSAILVKYITRRFIGEYDPTFEGCWTKQDNIDGIDVNVHVLDTHDRERKNLEKYVKWSDAIILVYSITNKQSFLDLNEYLDSLLEIAKRLNEDKTNENNKNSAFRIVLLANKIDMERHRQVNKNDIETLIKKYTPVKNSQNNNADNESNKCSDLPTINKFYLTHMETTACEEYELIQNVFTKILREIKCDRETIVSNNSNQPDDNNNTTANHQQPTTPTTSSRIKLKLTNSKRSKSPKSNINNIIHNSDLQQSNLINTNKLIDSNNTSNTISTANSNNNNNNISSNSNLLLTNTHSRNSSPSFSNRDSYLNVNNKATIQNSVTVNSSGSIKKNSSKFPFFKILNKSS